jgi:hypothetical protein
MKNEMLNLYVSPVGDDRWSGKLVNRNTFFVAKEHTPLTLRLRCASWVGAARGERKGIPSSKLFAVLKLARAHTEKWMRGVLRQ